MSTRYSLHFRSSSAGSGTSSPFSETSPSAYVLATDIYGSTTRNGLSFGYSATGALASNYSSATNARISGRIAIASSINFRVDLPDGPGIYKIWLAQGALTSTASTALQLFDGDGTTNLISPGAVVAGAPSTGNVIDATTNPTTVAAWLTADGGTPITVTISGDHFYIKRSGSTSAYVAAVEFQIQPVALVDATFKDDTGSTLTIIHSRQPLGQKLAKISAAGAQNFTLSGTLASYFAIGSYSDGYWLVATSTRLPDGASGTLILTQTDPLGSPSTTHNTDIIGGASSVTITTSGGRPTDTSILGLISTQTWLKRAVVITAVAGIWAGWTNQSFATDVTVTSAAQLVTELGNAVTYSNAHGNSSWHRIKCSAVGGGSWLTDVQLPTCDFGTGGVYITHASPTDDPQIGAYFTAASYARGYHFDNLTLTCQVYTTGTRTAANAYQFQMPGGSPTNYHKLRISNCRIGSWYGTGYTMSNFRSWPTFMFNPIGEDLALVNNTVRGVNDVLAVYNHKRILLSGNDCGLVYGDFCGLSDVYTASNPTPWTDMNVYAVGNTVRAAPDVFGTGGTSFLHPDTYQLRTPQRYWRIDKDASGNNIGFTPGGDFTYVNPNNGNVYVASTGAGGTTANNGTGPSGTGSGIVDGTVTWNFVKAYTPPKIHFYCEHMAITAGGTTSYVDTKTSKTTVVGRSLLQDNLTAITPLSSGANDYTFVNCLQGSVDQRGCIVQNGNLSVEYCTLAGPPTVPAYDSSHPLAIDAKTLQLVKSGTLRAKGNILGYNGGVPFITATGTAALAAQDNIVGGFLGTVPAGFTANDMLQGTFIQRAGDGLWTYTLDDSLSVDPVTFQSNFSKMMRPKTGRYGARLKELYTLTISDNAGKSVSTVLEVDP